MKKDYDEQIDVLKAEMKTQNTNYENSLNELKNDQSMQWNNLQENIICQLNELKVDIETANAETEEHMKTANEEISQLLGNVSKP